VLAITAESWLALHTPVLLEPGLPGLLPGDPLARERGSSNGYSPGEDHQHHPATGERYMSAGYASNFGGALAGVVLFVTGRAGLLAGGLLRRLVR
jgi:hypothetical protein